MEIIGVVCHLRGKSLKESSRVLPSPNKEGKDKFIFLGVSGNIKVPLTCVKGDNLRQSMYSVFLLLCTNIETYECLKKWKLKKYLKKYMEKGNSC